MKDSDYIFRPRMLHPDEKGLFLLSVYFPGPWGIGRSTYLVDDIEFIGTKGENGSPIALRGVRVGDDGKPITVVTFSGEFTYTMAARDQFEAVTIEQFKKEHKEEHGGEECPGGDTEVGRALSGGIAL